jgi:hypothetical protein
VWANFQGQLVSTLIGYGGGRGVQGPTGDYFSLGFVDNNCQLFVHIDASNTTNWRDCQTPGWHLFDVTFDPKPSGGAGPTVSAYDNGALVGSTILGGIPKTDPTGGSFFVGGQNSVQYDDAAVYDHALTIANLQSNYQSAQGVVPHCTRAGPNPPADHGPCLDFTFGQSSSALTTVDAVPVPASSLTAIVDWSDRTTSVLPVSDAGPNRVAVALKHTFWISGQFLVSLTLTNASGSIVRQVAVPILVESRFVTMGDSYSSGEGATYGKSTPGSSAPEYSAYGATDSSSDKCHRSDTSHGVVLNSNVIQNNIPGVELANVTCSGAIIQDLRTPVSTNPHGGFYPHNGGANPSDRVGEGAQMAALAPDVSLVLLGIGGNDLNFSGVLQDCIQGGEVDCLGDDAQVTRAEHAVKPVLIDLYRSIKQTAPGARVMVTGYPRFFPADGGSDQNCTGVTSAVHLDSRERRWMNTRIELANRMIAAAVAQSGVAEYVNIADAFSGHELCSNLGDTAKWDMNGLVLLGISPSQESFHPNPRGHAAEEKIIEAQYLGGRGSNSSQVVSVSVPPGSTRDVPLIVPLGQGLGANDSFTVWVSWTNDAHPRFTLLDGSGQPVQAATSVTGGGATYAFVHVFGLWSSGTWTLRAEDPPDQPDVATVVAVDASRLRLAPEVTISEVTTMPCSPDPSGFGYNWSGQLHGSATADVAINDPNNPLQSWAWEINTDPPITATGPDFTATLHTKDLPKALLSVTDSYGTIGYAKQSIC